MRGAGALLGLVLAAREIAALDNGAPHPLSRSPPLGRQSDPRRCWLAGLGLTPPMGWSSWNVFAGGIDEDKIMSTIDAMADLASAGYEYVRASPAPTSPPWPTC